MDPKPAMVPSPERALTPATELNLAMDLKPAMAPSPERALNLVMGLKPTTELNLATEFRPATVLMQSILPHLATPLDLKHLPFQIFLC